MLVIGPSDLATLMALMGLMAACAGAAGACAFWLLHGIAVALSEWFYSTRWGMELEDRMYVRAMNVKSRAQGGFTGVQFLYVLTWVALAVFIGLTLSGCSSEPPRIWHPAELSAHDQWIAAVKRGAW